MANHHHSSASSPHTHTNRCLPFSNFGQNQTMFSEYVYCCPIEVSARRWVGYNLVLVLGIIYVTDFEWMRCLVQQLVLPRSKLRDTLSLLVGSSYWLQGLPLAPSAFRENGCQFISPTSTKQWNDEREWLRKSKQWVTVTVRDVSERFWPSLTSAIIHNHWRKLPQIIPPTASKNLTHSLNWIDPF